MTKKSKKTKKENTETVQTESRATRIMKRSRHRLIILASAGAAALALVAAVIIVYFPTRISHPDSSGVRHLKTYEAVAKYLGFSQEQFKPWFEKTKQLSIIQMPVGPEYDPGTVAASDDIITFVVFGLDDGNFNTDVIMVCSLDLSDYSLNIVSIPRDTLVNLSTKNRHVNAAYYNKSGEKAVDRAKRLLQRDFKNFLGFEPDFYVTVNIAAFKKLINAIGGVDFDVPRDMNYEDPGQNLYIHLKKGMQHLDANTAIQLVRYRKGYSDADIGRIKTTQSFLMEAAKQILAKKSEIPLTTIIDIFFKDVTSASHQTDYDGLTMNYYTWLAGELLKIDSENITFSLMPGNYNDVVNGDSYVTIYVNEWTAMIGEKLHHTVTVDDLSLLTRDSNGKLYVTDGNWLGAQWTSSGAKPAPTTATPKPSTPTATAKPPVSSSPTPENPDATDPDDPNPSDETPAETPNQPQDTPPETPTGGDDEPGGTGETPVGGDNENENNDTTLGGLIYGGFNT